MRVRLEAIKFNHDTLLASSDAFNIRRNEALFVNVPEWRRGVNVNPEDSPAAYALRETFGQTITIQADFTCEGFDGRPPEVRALDARLDPRPSGSPTLEELIGRLMRPALCRSVGNVLGEVKARHIPAVEGNTGFQTFELEHVGIWDAGVGVQDIAWRWQYRLDGSAEWTDIATTTHRIYTVVGVPRKPWQQQDYMPSNTQLPWVEVLDRACVWAEGARNTDDAAAMITRSVNDLGQGVVHYCGSEHYTDNNNFDCTSFLQLLRGECGGGEFVNCDDCAAIVSTFANALGCDLRQLSLSSEVNFSFDLKPVIKIGIPDWDFETSFTHHTVASEGGCDVDQEVFDACLKLDGDDDPCTLTALLPTNLRFGRVGERTYRFRLVLNEEQGRSVLPETQNCKLRRIGAMTNISPRNEGALNFVKEFFEFDSWSPYLTPPRTLFVSDFFLADYLLPGLRLVQVRESEPGARERYSQSLWAMAEGESPFLRIDVYERASAADALEGVMAILTTFQELDMTQQEEAPELGDVAFANACFTSILFATGNLVFFLRNACRGKVSLRPAAMTLNKSLRNQPPGSQREMGSDSAVRRFSLASDSGPIGAPVRIESKHADTLARRRLYVFFTDKGEVSLQDEGLRYLPGQTGQNEVAIFAADSRGDYVRQVLPFQAG
ncbi:MAG: hypothetical protein ACJ74Q_17995 [Pyrinomonadaceae bacterium]